MESGSSNAILWVIHDEPTLWKLHFCFNEIMALPSHFQVVFCHVDRLANSIVDALAKQGVDGASLWGVFSA